MKGFAQLSRQLNLGTIEDKGRQQTTALRTGHLLKPRGNRPARISDRSPRFVQHLPLIPPKLTPAAKPAETVGGPRHKRMNTELRCLQSIGELQPPALLGRGWARPKDELSATSVGPTIDALHID